MTNDKYSNVFRRMLTIAVAFIMMLGTMLPAVTQTALAKGFSGKVAKWQSGKA